MDTLPLKLFRCVVHATLGAIIEKTVIKFVKAYDEQAAAALAFSAVSNIDIMTRNASWRVCVVHPQIEPETTGVFRDAAVVNYELVNGVVRLKE